MPSLATCMHARGRLHYSWLARPLVIGQLAEELLDLHTRHDKTPHVKTIG